MKTITLMVTLLLVFVLGYLAGVQHMTPKARPIHPAVPPPTSSE